MALSILDAAPLILGLLVLAVILINKNKKYKKKDDIFNVKDKKKKKKSNAKEHDEAKPTVICFFGSQTGTAEGYAKQAATELNRNGFNAKSFDLEEFDKDEFKNNTPYALFFMATYGEGEPCDNSIEFIDFIKKAPSDGGPSKNFASKVKYSVFGLGNTEYEHYNAMGKLVNKRIGELGGKLIHPYGEGDDDKDIEEDFAEWCTDLAKNFRKSAGLSTESGSSMGGKNPQERESEYEYKALFVPDPDDKRQKKSGGRITANESKVTPHEIDLTSRHLFQGVKSVIVVNKELRQKTLDNGGLGSTVHVEFDIQGTGLKYNTADNLTVCPANDISQVKSTARYLRLSLKQWFVLESAKQGQKVKPLFPTPCNVETALRYFTDLNGSPTRSLLEKLAPFATLLEHRDRLYFLASKEGKQDYSSYITDRKLSIAEIFETFPSFKITEENLGPFFEVMPRLKSRDFTIASSSNLSPDRIALTVGVVREMKPGAPEGRILNGVCSNFIKAQDPKEPKSQEALVFVKESSFKLPKNPLTPIILIGPGTGIAPMRAFIQERIFQKTLGEETGDTILFFGCRREDEDFIYKDELMRALKTGALTKLHTAFSRQQKQKVYVQHLMAQEKAALWDYIENEGAYIYVCGATSMGKDVNLALQAIVQEFAGYDASEAKQYITDLQKRHRYVQELWSA